MFRRELRARQGDPAGRRCRPGGAFALALALAAAPAGASDLERGDAAWARRAEGQQDAKARPEPIAAAVAAYEAAVAANPGDLEASWKLLRALWFLGDFASPDAAAERAAYERARRAADAAVGRLAARLGDASLDEAARPGTLRAELPVEEARDAASFYFWAAVNLGAWARSAGLLQAVRAGVANRLHEYTVLSIALDPSVEAGGAIRLLSRLHAELPHVPFLSGFVDRGQALPLAERAVAEYPEHPGNPYLLGLTLLELAPARRAEALRRVAQTAILEPRPEQLVEDTALRDAARRRLEEEEGTVRPASSPR